MKKLWRKCWVIGLVFLFSASLSFGSWTVETLDSEGYMGKYSAIALDPSDYVHISYHDYYNSDLKYATNKP